VLLEHLWERLGNTIAKREAQSLDFVTDLLDEVCDEGGVGVPAFFQRHRLSTSADGVLSVVAGNGRAGEGGDGAVGDGETAVCPSDVPSARTRGMAALVVWRRVQCP
jgi:hypothetical protein